MDSDEKMRADWDARAATQRSAMRYILDGYTGDTAAFFDSGRKHVEDIFCALRAAGVATNQLYAQTAVEVGCGLGRLTLWLASYFEHVYATDVSRAMIAKCLPLPNATYICTPTLTNVGLPRVDYVLSHIVFQHVPKAIFWRYLAEAHVLLKKGGVFHTQLHATSRPVDYGPEETLLVRGYTEEELIGGIDRALWRPLSVLGAAGLSETWRWVTLQKL